MAQAHALCPVTVSSRVGSRPALCHGEGLRELGLVHSTGVRSVTPLSRAGSRWPRPGMELQSTVRQLLQYLTL